MDKKNIILIPVDFSEESVVAIDYAKLIAPMFMAKIHLLHVIEGKNPILHFLSENDKPLIEKKIGEKLGNIVDTLAFDNTVESSFSIEYGNLIDSILKKRKSLDAKLIIIGTTGSKDIRRKIIGSNALRIIREAECPVISIKSKDSFKKIDNIILPLDTSKVTKQKVAHGVFFAKYFNATVHLVSVETGDNFIESDTAIQQLEETSEFLENQNIPCSIKLLRVSSSSGKMAKAIVEYAHEMQADIIMIMTRQELEFRQFYVGSFAKEIIHKANIPVFSVSPKNEF